MSRRGKCRNHDLFRIVPLSKKEIEIRDRERERIAEEESMITLRPIHLQAMSTEKTLKAIATFAKV